MPSLPRRGSIESSVRSMVAKGYGAAQIVTSLVNRGRNYDPTKVSQYIEKYATKFNKTQNLASFKKPTTRQEAQLKTTKFSGNMQRVTANLQYLSPDSGELKEDSFYVDIPAGLSHAQQTQEVLNRIGQRFSEAYQGVIKTESQLAYFLLGVSFEGD